jgi:hypothetical protein
MTTTQTDPTMADRSKADGDHYSNTYGTCCSDNIKSNCCCSDTINTNTLSYNADI